MVEFKEQIQDILNNGKCNFWTNLFNCLDDNNNKDICIFGAGELGIYVYDILKENRYDIKCFSDNKMDKWDCEIVSNIKCISFNDFLNLKAQSIVLVASFYYEDIIQQLSSHGFENIIPIFNSNYLNFQYKYENEGKDIRNKVMKVMDLLEDDESKRVLIELIKGYFMDSPTTINYDSIHEGNQGFAKGIINLSTEESFVDCGALNGDTLEEFFKRVNNEFSYIYAFEMDQDNYKELEKKIYELGNNQKEKIIAYNIGLWNEKGSIKYNNKSTGASNISALGDSIAYIDKIDNILQDKLITFIKMDIEGAEMEALEGSSEILKTQKPKLAISIYHKMQDLWEIPLYIKSIVPDYKIYIRHHTTIFCDTMCYAIKK